MLKKKWSRIKIELRWKLELELNCWNVANQLSCLKICSVMFNQPEVYLQQKENREKTLKCIWNETWFCFLYNGIQLYWPHPINPVAKDIMRARIPVIIWPALDRTVSEGTAEFTTSDGTKRSLAVILSWYLFSRSKIRPLVQPKPIWTSYSPPPPWPPETVASYYKFIFFFFFVQQNPFFYFDINLANVI